MTSQDAGTLLVALAVVLLPGAGLMLALGVRRPLLFAGLAPAASVGVAVTVGMLGALTGFSYGIVSLGVATGLFFLVGVVRLWRSGISPGPVRPPWWTWLAGALVFASAVWLGIRTWLAGLVTLSSPPQEHDTILHSELVAYIVRSGRGAPWQLMPYDFLDGTPVAVYPSGMHLLAAATSEATGGVVRGLNGVTVVMLAFCLAMCTAALAYAAARRARVAAALSFLAGGVAALVAVGLYAPMIAFSTMGGILPNAVAMALTPGALAALLSLRRREWSAAAAAGVACAGLVAVHPSTAMSVGLTLAVWWTVDLFFDARRVGHQAALLGVIAPVAGVLAAPLLVAFSAVSGRTAAFPPDVRATTFANALGDALGLPLVGFLPQHDGQSQVAALVFAAVGIVTLLMTRREVGLVAATGVWVVITVAMWLSPAKGLEAPVTSFFYHSMVRIRSHFNLLVPVLAGVGLILVAVAIAKALRNRWVATAVVVGVAAGYAIGPAMEYVRTNESYLKSRYGTPDLLRVDRNDLAAFDFLAGKVGPGERVLNSANDGSTYLYVLKGIPTVNTLAFGFDAAPYTYRLLQRFHHYPTDPEIRRYLVERNVTWVYVDTDPPPIGALYSPENWAGGGTFRFPDGFTNLDGLPGLTEEFRSGPVRVYKLDLASIR